MTDATAHLPPAGNVRLREPDPRVALPVVRIRRLIWKMAIATWILMAIGSATRVMNAGLACPDWPLCYGTLFPAQQMNMQVFLEWIHRLDAALLGVMAIALVTLSWGYRPEVPRWLPWASLGALFLIMGQGLLGALTVMELLRFDIVTAHLGTALGFFITLLVMACCLLPDQATGTGVVALPLWSGVAAGLIYLQSLLGGLVGSQWAAHQCLAGAQMCWLVRSHLLGVGPPTLAILGLVLWARRTPALAPPLRQLTIAAGGLLLLQVGLGVATLYLHLQIEFLTIAHQMVGAALLGSLVCFTALASRDRQPQR